MPEGGSSWSLAELRINCRNTREIAKFVSQFGGGVSASASPEGDPVEVVSVSDEAGLIDAVLNAVSSAYIAQGKSALDVVVITGTAAERNLFYELDTTVLNFGKWEDRSEQLIACETVKRAKGIEAGHVIFATLNENIRDNELYVGASRARTKLVIVGPKSFEDRFESA
jgi:hypothetical protein